MSNQQELDRVKARIGWAIRVFYHERKQSGDLCFHCDDLRRFVRARVGEIAPGSPDRIMRDMRQDGEIDYLVLSRKDSLYQIKVKPQQMSFNI